MENSVCCQNRISDPDSMAVLSDFDAGLLLALEIKW